MIALRKNSLALLVVLAVIAAPARAQTPDSDAPAAPASLKPASSRSARPHTGAMKIVVSLKKKRLWLIQGRDTLIDAPVAIGMDTTFEFRGQTFRFETPAGTRRVLSKQTDPLWSPPDWHYYELAAQHGLEPIRMNESLRVGLLDGSVIEMRDSMIVRQDMNGKIWHFPPGTEIIFDGKVFVPPAKYPQRRVPEILGTHKLDLGNGYLIHGTNEEDSIGEAVSHGCVRMYNEDVAKLYALVPLGTPVIIQ